MEQDPRLRALREMADAVARVVKDAPVERFGDELGVGADGTATKLVDDLAEREILAILKRKGKGPRMNLLSEEIGFVDLGGESLLVADPIDGTTNAARGIPFYCIALGVGRKSLSDIEVGLVQNLSNGDRYEAIAGAGAWFTPGGSPGKPRALRVRPTQKDSVIGVGLGRGAEPVTPPSGGALRSFGATALEMCLVAQGGFDCYHYSKPILRIIDVAASTLIVREAGGIVLDRHGQDLELPLSLVPRFGLTAASSREAIELAGVRLK